MLSAWSKPLQRSYWQTNQGQIAVDTLVEDSRKRASLKYVLSSVWLLSLLDNYIRPSPWWILIGEPGILWLLRGSFPDESPTLAVYADIFEGVLALSINHTNTCPLLPLVRYLEMVAKTASEQEVDFLYAVWCVWGIPASSKKLVPCGKVGGIRIPGLWKSRMSSIANQTQWIRY